MGLRGRWHDPFVARGSALLPDDLADHGPADPVSLGDLGQAHAVVTVSEDGGPVDIQRPPPNLPAFEPGPPHAGPNPLHDQTALELGDGADDDDDGAAQRPAGVDVFSERNELDVEVAELVEHLDEVLDGAGQPVEGPHQDDVELAATGSLFSI